MKRREVRTKEILPDGTWAPDPKARYPVDPVSARQCAELKVRVPILEAQVAQLRRALLALATWMEANDDLGERGLSKGAREDLDKALIAIESTGPKP